MEQKIIIIYLSLDELNYQISFKLNWPLCDFRFENEKMWANMEGKDERKQEHGKDEELEEWLSR